MQPKCEGACDKTRDGHAGEVRRVRVRKLYEDWGEFNYCEVAIDIDRAAGFTVDILKGGTDAQVPTD